MSTYIKHSEDDSLTHYGVKGMKWKKRKAKALDIAWELRHPLRGSTHTTTYESLDPNGWGDRYERNENRRSITTKTYEKENGKWKYKGSKTVKKKLKKKPSKKNTSAGKKAVDKIKAAGHVKATINYLHNSRKRGGIEKHGYVSPNGYRGNRTVVKGARGSNRKKVKGKNGWL